MVSKQKLEGDYNPTEPVKRFDDWIVSQHNVPNTVQQIDQRLLEILGNSKYDNLAEQYLDAVHESATYGNVPNNLFDTDPAYWLKTSIMASCDADSSCIEKAEKSFS
ncbi:MAG: hypothetical protein KGL95_02160, partial [Patescibacteria group bacterium]|nr:hypothetical protein [Patescibacteria group bacterium]